jgi:membrane protease YdiL (CAAX protease family)
MSAPTGSAPVSPFLAFVSPQDRSPMRVGLWLALGLPMAFFGCVLVVAVASLLDSSLLKAAAAPDRHPFLHAGRDLGLVAFVNLGMALPVLGAARLAFQRPAWTFVSPTRPFAPRMMILGAAACGLITAVFAAAKIVEGGVAPALLDAHQALEDRLLYVAACAPLALLANAAQEILFRGVILQVSGAFIRTRIGLCVMNGLVNALLFALLFSQPNPLVFLNLAATGAVFAYAVLELGGLEFSIGAGATVDFVTLLVDDPASSAPTAPFQWSDLVTPAALTDLGNLVAIVLLTLVAVRLIKRRRAPLG